jgi:hypothetical protein
VPIAELAPPTTLHSSATAEAVALGGMAVTLVVLFIWAALRREWMLPVMLVGAAAASLVEAQLDVLSRIWWAEDLVGAYEYFGVHVPLFAVMGYSLLIGGGAYGTYRIIRSGATRSRVFALAAAFFVVESSFEIVWMGFDVYEYFGPQPLEVLGFPLYWGIVNTCTAVTAGYVIFRVRPLLRGPSVLLLALVPPLAFGVDFAVSWPTWGAIHAGFSSLALSFVAFITIALCALELWIVSTAVERDSVGKQPATGDGERAGEPTPGPALSSAVTAA